MTSILIKNIGTLVTGKLENPLRQADSIFIRDGVIHALGIKLVKFIFYDYSLLPNGEANCYVEWAHARGIKVKIHSGGVSRSGVSQVAGFEMVQKIKPDIIG